MSGADVVEAADPAQAAAGARRMDAATLLQSLRALRGSPRDAGYWNRLCVCLSHLCRARGAMIVRAQPGAAWQLLGSCAAADSALNEGSARWLAELAPRALEAGQAYAPQPRDTLAAAVRLHDPAGPALVLLEIPARERASINELLLRAQLVADVPAAASQAAAPTQPPPAGAVGAHGGLVDLLDLVARVMQESEFGAATLGLVNLLAAQLGCDQAVLGWSRDGHVRAIAISHIDRFEHRAENVQMLEAALEEAVDQRCDLLYPPAAQEEAVYLAHDRLARAMGYARLATLSFLADAQDADQPQIALLLARREGEFDPQRLQDVSVAVHLLRPWLQALRERSQPWAVRRWNAARRRLSDWASPRHPARKLAALGAVLALAVIVLGTWPYRIEAPAELATESVQVVSAPFDGHLARANAQLGETVRAGTVLAELDARELQLQAADLRSELRRYQAEADRARAAAQVADTQIAEARAQQAQARLQRVEFQLAQSRVVASTDGVVVEGERKELLGAPVRQGDKLYRVARVEGLYAVLQVSERDARELPAQARGELRLLSRPDRSLPFHVERVVPVVQPKGGVGGHFEVRVRLDTPPEPWWRPGMSGLAHVEAGDRRILWIWTHRLVDQLRMWLWW